VECFNSLEYFIDNIKNDSIDNGYNEMNRQLMVLIENKRKIEKE